MRRIAVVTDSTCCLPAELVARYSIHVVPLLICFAGKSHRDNVDITAQEVYRIMRRDEDLPTTSVPTPDDFSKAFIAAGKEAEGIVCITLTGLQSKTYETAVLGKKLAEEVIPRTGIEVIDSRAVSGALGFTVLEAARAAENGADLKEVCEAARRTMSRVNFLAMVDTLHFLARTGRIARAAAWAGAVLNMKPVLEHSTSIGETTPFARPRSKAKAVELMLQTMTERMGNSTVHVLVHHADELEEGEKLKVEVARRFKCAELYLTEFTPIMGVHAGPGVLAIAFWKEEPATSGH
ncbi:MAG TPA: DegV family protein [Dehalococcoidia bacterium]|nr:DegV family protein [Dehalococcoidia bacterium]